MMPTFIFSKTSYKTTDIDSRKYYPHHHFVVHRKTYSCLIDKI